MMRAFVQPETYNEQGLALSWSARLYPGADDPALCFAEERDYIGVCLIRRGRIDGVEVGPLHGAIDGQVNKDIRRALRLSGIKQYDWARAGRAPRSFPTAERA